MNKETSSPDHDSLNRTALSATIHCLTGCGIGEVLGMVIGTAIGLGTWPTIGLAVMLAFFFLISTNVQPTEATAHSAAPSWQPRAADGA